MYIPSVSVMQVHHVCLVRTSFFFIGGRIYDYVGFLLKSTRKVHLIPGAIVVSVRFFPHWKTIGVNIIYQALNSLLIMGGIR